MGSSIRMKLLAHLWIFFASRIAIEGFDDLPVEHHETSARPLSGSLPKDKIFLEHVNKLTFSRNKMTTSRRTHSIHQLTCVGGTAGCKLFRPDIVECEKGKFDKKKFRYDWECKADIDDRVRFNHVEVICEGYEYPEDDYILLGSCGLEFTLDYKDPHDHHHTSYFRHMDEHEKEMHRERSQAKIEPPPAHLEIVKQFLSVSSDYPLMTLLCIVGLVCSALVWIIVKRAPGDSGSTTLDKKYLTKAPRHLAAAVMTSKKAC